ncbi:hypothetical protein [Micromonospora sp. Llam0]|uniref:hypothetical protein n=1 Tax=Micromonospora sp. Llam0 TaxID=2485143 RepID=UPI0011CDD6A8|nr:hypothetical protein [Micromonospora sp. Llam0]
MYQSEADLPESRSRSAQIGVDDVGQIKKVLTAAYRTTEGVSDAVIQRFIEPRVGLLDQLMAEAHHLIEGRRGTGKSTILQVLRRQALEEGIPVAFVDMEKHKHRKYPDVLVELLIDVLNGLQPQVPRWAIFGNRRSARREFDKIIRALRQILEDPDAISRAMMRAADRKTSGAGSVKAAINPNIGLDASVGRGSSRSWAEEGSVEFTKIERLRDLAPRLSGLLARLVSETTAQRSIIFVDDFYYINTADQPYVLDYLHQVCKGTSVWIKICGVGSRLKPYIDSNPPVGMEPGNDIFRLGLDVTLENFVTAKRFLERVVEGILAPLDFKITDILSEIARERIILASGGAVARDYINLIDDALDIALQQVQKKNQEEAARFRIGTEDIMQAARNRLNKKEEEDLTIDARENHNALRARWQHIQKFARSNETQFVLFRQEELSETAWGAEVQQLQNLRLLHRITTAVPNTATWRGVKTVVVMIDLASVARQRLNQVITPFWKNQAEMDKLRRAEWVYSPDFEESMEEKLIKKSAKKLPTKEATDPTLF